MVEHCEVGPIYMEQFLGGKDEAEILEAIARWWADMPQGHTRLINYIEFELGEGTKVNAFVNWTELDEAQERAVAEVLEELHHSSD